MTAFRFASFLCMITLTTSLLAQEQQYKVTAIGFYSLENLFDTLDTPDVRDSEFTPQGSKHYNTKIYHEKLDHLAQVISEMGTELTPHGPALLGVSEIENKSVLEDLVAHPKIANRDYQIIHFDSPDKRGIDVALLYQPKYFAVARSTPIKMDMYKADSSRVYTRDILWVSGNFDGEILHVLVNHWPSRSGGQAASQVFRNQCAQKCKEIVESLTNYNKEAKVLIMGNLNDNPTSPSVKKVLATQGKKAKVKPGGLYNPMFNFHKKGIGSNTYRDSWSLFDQMMLTSGFLNDNQDGYYFMKTKVFNPPYLTQKTGQYKGYPFRTFVGDTYMGGYSDHFPVYTFLLKKI